MSLQLLFSAAGVLLPFAAIGIWQHIVRPFRFSLVRPVHASALALIVGVNLFHAAVPATDFPRRYLLPCLVPLLIFVVPGFEWAASKLPFDRWSLHHRRLAIAVTTLIAFFAFQFSLVRRTRAGFAPAAALLAQQAQPRVVLVASDAPREGMAVAEIALRDRRPRHYVVRGSKVLAHSDWFGGGYRPLFNTSQEIFSYLDSVPVDYVLVDNRPARLPPHVDLLAQTLHAGSQTWRQAPVSAGPLTLWERVHPIAHGEPTIRVDMNNTLRGTLSVGPRTSGR
jgi:hypothetical protein